MTSLPAFPHCCELEARRCVRRITHVYTIRGSLPCRDQTALLWVNLFACVCASLEDGYSGDRDHFLLPVSRKLEPSLDFCVCFSRGFSLLLSLMLGLLGWKCRRDAFLATDPRDHTEKPFGTRTFIKIALT